MADHVVQFARDAPPFPTDGVADLLCPVDNPRIRLDDVPR
ncbi:hypothetical protein BKA15_004443 [Microlunatus parietis]|uniref:Uncharacterized protein n=1 Tax=Microlunatus parietis TaxID=682979 RepID=A0A7Y9IB43_9ACTN|nr:hypothetical protein [Microlunatus parietis]